MQELRSARADQQVLVPAASAPSGSRVEFPVIELDGVKHIAVFTSEAQLARGGRENADHIRLANRRLARLWPPDIAMAINPSGDLGFSMPAEDVEALRVPLGGGGRARNPGGSRADDRGPGAGASRPS